MLFESIVLASVAAFDSKERGTGEQKGSPGLNIKNYAV